MRANVTLSHALIVTEGPANEVARSIRMDTSTTTTHVDPDLTQLALIDALHELGKLDADIDLPIIIVTGSQSSGKSSLIQAISGVPLPRAPGDACTRCPIECRLRRGDGCVHTSDPRLSGQSKVPFGNVITDKYRVEDRVWRAQLAILNPRNSDPTAPTEVSFSPDIVCLEITSPNHSDISFVDLPGLIRNVGTSGNRDNIQLIENLAQSYISKENCIVLMTITCETDFANQGAYDLARTCDPPGQRTVGVLTKPDRCPETAHQKWVRYIANETEPLRHGWFCVKMHDMQTPHPPPTLDEAREQEEQYFNKTSVWKELPRSARSRLGSKRLVLHLEDILSGLISARIPVIIQQVVDLAEATARKLRDLGKPPSDDCIVELNTLVDQLVRDIESGIERTSGDDNSLLRLIESDAVKFKDELRATCPEFRAWNKNAKIEERYKGKSKDKDKDKDLRPITPLPELLLEDEETLAKAGTRKVIYLDDVLKKKTRSSARGLPDGGQNEVAEEYLRSFTANWNAPTTGFVRRATQRLKNIIHKTIDARCRHFSHGELPKHLRETIDAHLDECIAEANEATALLLKLEENGHTRNNLYYRECKEKFLNHLKMQRNLASDNPVLRDLSRLASHSDEKPIPAFTSAVNQAKIHLNKLLLPPEASDSALEDMAKASAGFEVSLHRFVDYVPLIVDTILVRGVCQDLAIILRQSFRFSEPGAAERCADFLREPDEVKVEREHLKMKMQRLTLAREELSNFWGP
ncbi:P-loop containing nucleoside triphosphate hydrolase protein [Russula brevipes]|nr:P-loop containing nucleoside triphosphate hydrolase protein [Russula brevipes]